jgi:hypothetical protein
MSHGLLRVLVDLVGMRRVHALSSIGYLVGLALVLLAPRPDLAPGATVTSIFAHSGTTMLYAGFLTMGLSQGLVEGVINPLIATLYKDQKSRMLNVLHAWWPEPEGYDERHADRSRGSDPRAQGAGRARQDRAGQRGRLRGFLS